MDDELFDDFLEELNKNESKPYHMANKPLADDFFRKVKQLYPTATIYIYGTSQFICKDVRAQVELAKYIQSQKDRLQDEIEKTDRLLTSILRGVMK